MSPSIKIFSGLTKGQVLQRLGSRGASVILKGEATTDGPVTVTIFRGSATLKGWKKKSVGKIVRGKFSVKIAGIPAGGPYRLRLEADGQSAEVPSFFVGDVWILAGQSNMEGVGDMVGKAKPHPLVRAFSMRREWRLAEDPLHILSESPDSCHAETQCTPEAGEEMRQKAGKGVGAGVFFAREMVERSGGVPQGLICTAHGGTSMQQWNPGLSLVAAASDGSAFGPDPAHFPEKPHDGKSLYGSMLESVRAAGQPVSGVLWYQGESDASPVDAPLYEARMKELVAASRRDLRQPRLPWVIVQLSRVCSFWPNGRGWNSIQEEQRRLPGKIKFFETVPAIDLPLDDGIHIGAAGFPRLAARLASAADRLVHGNSHEAPMPRLRTVRVIESHSSIVEVVFDSIRGELQALGEPVGFRLISPGGQALDGIYKTELKGNTARLHLGDRLIPGSLLFYGYGTNPICNITDGRGFSLPVFGPVLLGSAAEPKALLPFVNQWETTDLILTRKKLDQVSLQQVKSLKRTVKTFPTEGFVNEHAVWEGKSGQAFFQSRLHLPEPMKLEFLMGYDGPFRLWLDDKPFFVDMKGTNPCLPDEVSKIATLAAGTHSLQVGMDLNGGRAWGFCLRLARVDVPKDKLWMGEFTKPTYSI